MNAAEIRKTVDQALARHRKFGAGSAYHVGAEVALEDALSESTGEFRSVGVINGPATVKNMTAAARAAWPAKRGGERGGAGRPQIDGARKVNVLLPADTIEQARKLGDGNLSLGLRIAVKSAAELC